MRSVSIPRAEDILGVESEEGMSFGRRDVRASDYGSNTCTPDSLCFGGCMHDFSEVPLEEVAHEAPDIFLEFILSVRKTDLQLLRKFGKTAGSVQQVPDHPSYPIYSMILARFEV